MRKCIKGFGFMCVITSRALSLKELATHLRFKNRYVGAIDQRKIINVVISSMHMIEGKIHYSRAEIE